MTPPCPFAATAKLPGRIYASPTCKGGIHATRERSGRCKVPRSVKTAPYRTTMHYFYYFIKILTTAFLTWSQPGVLQLGLCSSPGKKMTNRPSPSSPPACSGPDAKPTSLSVLNSPSGLPSDAQPNARRRKGRSADQRSGGGTQRCALGIAQVGVHHIDKDILAVNIVRPFSSASSVWLFSQSMAVSRLGCSPL